ncbi:hypothetical protein ACWA1F_06815 [Flavobacterium sp. 3-218]
MNKITLLIVTLLIKTLAFSQQIGDGHAPVINDFTIPLKSGAYSGSNAFGVSPDLSHPWQHLFVVRHTDTNNNCQLQLTSSFAENDRFFFRKIITAGVAANPTWIEIATRGSNTFTGNQYINGSIVSSISSDTGGFISLINPSKNSNGTAQRWTIYNMTGPYGNSLQFCAYDNLGCVSGGLCESRLAIMDSGNVGIGTSSPDSKLAVNGTIHSKEVKVDMYGWPDYIFKKEYDLPTLAEVENHIKEKGHLENIPSEEEVLKNGIQLGEMNAKLLQKIEELTLYLIDQNKSIENLIKENKQQNEEILSLKRKLQ